MNFVLVLEILGSLAVQAAVFLTVCSWLARRAPNHETRDRLWATAHILLLCLVAVDFLLPHGRWVVISSFTPTVLYPAILTAAEWVGRILVSVWLVGAVGYLTLIGIGLCRGLVQVRGARRLSPDDPPALRELAASLARRGAIAIQIRISPTVPSPFLWQLHRPTIILPEYLLQFPEDELRAIACHELAHFQCRHPLHLFLQRLLETAFWYHPTVWKASRQAAVARELRCDAASVGSAEQAASYLRSLVRLMEVGVAHHFLAAGSSFLGDGRLLQQRTAALMQRFTAPPHAAPPRERRFQPLPVMVAALALAALLWLPLNPTASRRSLWSPWPSWSARTLSELGVPVRDYEIDGHRLRPHEHTN